MITVNKIKSLVPISKNIGDYLIQPQINIAEIKYIKPVLGKLLFDDIQLKYSGQTLNTIETSLVELVQYSLAYYVVENTLPFLSMQISEKGIQFQNGVNSKAADETTNSTSNISYMRNELRNNAELFSDQVRDFLNENVASFPLYNSPTNNPKQDSSYDAGIVFYPDSENINRRGYFY